MEIRETLHEKIDPQDLRSLLETYPYKDFQYQLLGISRSDLARYQCDAFLKSKPEDSLFYTFEQDGKKIAGFSLCRHDWHSELFGIQFFQVLHLLLKDRLNSGVYSHITTRLVEETARREGDLLSVRVDCEDLVLQQALTQKGFFVVGHSVKMALPTRKLDITSLQHYTSPKENRSSVGIREFVPDDLPVLKQITSASHRHSHFFNDPRLLKRGTERLFPDWVEKCCRGLAAAVLVAEETENGTPVGFIILLLNDSLAKFTGKRAGVIDFIAVAPKSQGQGIGKQLLASGLEWLRERTDYIELRTELANFPAIRLYRSFGFVLVSADVNFHFWI